MTRHRGGTLPAAVAGVLSALALAACGGSDDPPSGPAGSGAATAPAGSVTAAAESPAGTATDAAPGATTPEDAPPGTGTDPSAATPDAAAYERAGGALCARARDEAMALPQVQRDEGLSIGQVQERAAASGRRFNAAFGELRPPAALRAAHERVLAGQRELAAAGSTTDVGRIIRRQQEMARRYAAAGQTTCARLMRASTRQLREVEKRTVTTTTGP